MKGIFDDFPYHEKLVSLLDYLPQMTEIIMKSVEPDNLKKVILPLLCFLLGLVILDEESSGLNEIDKTGMQWPKT